MNGHSDGREAEARGFEQHLPVNESLATKCSSGQKYNQRQQYINISDCLRL